MKKHEAKKNLQPATVDGRNADIAPIIASTTSAAADLNTIKDIDDSLREECE